jgi:hypothetical protein
MHNSFNHQKTANQNRIRILSYTSHHQKNKQQLRLMSLQGGCKLVQPLKISMESPQKNYKWNCYRILLYHS